jgi:hypothetical protein
MGEQHVGGRTRFVEDLHCESAALWCGGVLVRLARSRPHVFERQRD